MTARVRAEGGSLAPWVVVLIGAFLALGGRAAGADEPKRVLVFPFEGFDLPPALEKAPNTVGAVVELRFRTEGFDIAASPMLLRDMVVAVGCTAMDTACAKALAGHFEVDVLVIGKLVGKDGKAEALIRRYARDGTLVTDLREILPGAAAELPAAYARYAEKIVTGREPAGAGAGTGSGTGAGTGSGTGAGTGTGAGGGGGGFLSTPTIALGAGGVALAAAALPFALLTAKANRDIEALGTLEGRAEFEEAADVEKRGKLFARLTQVLLVAGGAALGAAVVVGAIGGGGGKAAVSAVPLAGGALVTLEVPWN